MKIEAVILAAGKGTRMKSDIPKVMHTLAGKPMIEWIIESVMPACDTINVVTGFGREMIESYLSRHKNIKFSFQNKQDGTGGAVRSAVPNISGDSTHILICAGDTPLIKTETLKKITNHLQETKSDVVVVSTILNDAGHYGRIVRNLKGEVSGIVEYLDADDKQIKINEINSGIYLIEKKFLVEAVYKIRNNNSKYEYYLTDIIKIASLMGKKVTSFVEEDSISLTGINDTEQLKEAEKELQKRLTSSGKFNPSENS